MNNGYNHSKRSSQAQHHNKTNDDELAEQALLEHVGEGNRSGSSNKSWKINENQNQIVVINVCIVDFRYDV